MKYVKNAHIPSSITFHDILVASKPLLSHDKVAGLLTLTEAYKTNNSDIFKTR